MRAGSMAREAIELSLSVKWPVVTSTTGTEGLRKIVCFLDDERRERSPCTVRRVR